jgi:hypothetical protein
VAPELDRGSSGRAAPRAPAARRASGDGGVTPPRPAAAERPGDEATPRQERDANTAGDAAKVLLVDDRPRTCSPSRRSRAAVADVMRALSGPEALRQVLQHDFA